jgi:3-deoxy-D-manno-octulosonate 8-phosphate phosphatase (KDO 8-P phosphatase)
MNGSAEIESLFSGLGASFLLSGEDLKNRLQNVRAFVFDWDGVFNRGEKGEGSSSTFSEPDSMGTNLLRYAYWRARGSLPICVVVSGARNATAELFARREHFNAVYCGVRDKATAFDSLGQAHSIKREEVAYVFDDANDLSVAQDCSLRFLVRRDANPLLREYAVRNGLVDYVTAARSGEYPVREVAELLIGMLGDYPAVYKSRQSYDNEYREYFSARESIETSVFNAD